MSTVTKQDESSCKNKWTLVTSRKQVKANKKVDKDSANTTIFLYGIPAKATEREIWNLFKLCGVILDIILPIKRDKHNQRIGFIKTTSELEA